MSLPVFHGEEQERGRKDQKLKYENLQTHRVHCTFQNITGSIEKNCSCYQSKWKKYDLIFLDNNDIPEEEEPYLRSKTCGNLKTSEDV